MYAAEVQLLNDIGPLAQATPRLAIRLPSLAHQGEALLAGILSMIGLVLGVVGTLWLGNSIVRRRNPSAA